MNPGKTDEEKLKIAKYRLEHHISHLIGQPVREFEKEFNIEVEIKIIFKDAK